MSVAELALRTHKSQINKNTVYVDAATGNDSFPGSAAQPFKTIGKAVRDTTASNIFIKPGNYPPFDFRRTDKGGTVFKHLKVWGKNGAIMIRPLSVDNFAGLAWKTVAPNVYQAQLSATSTAISRLLNNSNLDEYRLPTPLPQRNSEQAVLSLGSGWFYDLNTRKVTVAGLTKPPSKVLSVVYGDIKSQLMVYGTNILFDGYFHFVGTFITAVGYGPSSAMTRAEVYLMGTSQAPINFWWSFSDGVNVLQGASLFAQRVSMYRTAIDSFHYVSQDPANPALGVEIDCNVAYAGDSANFRGLTQADGIGNGTLNGSSAHYESYVIRVNGRYHHSNGPNLPDNGIIWNIGTEAYKSEGPVGTRVGFYAIGPGPKNHRTVYDTCYSHGNADGDLAVLAGGQMSTYNSRFSTTWLDEDKGSALNTLKSAAP